MAHLDKESDAIQENESLKKQLEVWDDAKATRLLDPRVVLPSKWANRHLDSFAGPDYLELKSEIESAGVNVQPIKVRPIPSTDPQQFEIVFGHRRHRACADLGIKVLALIESVSDQVLFQEMERENRLRADLRPYEQGVMYARALDDGLFPSARKLAEAIGADLSNVGKAIKLARFPSAVLEAFPSPLELQYRWVQSLEGVLEKDRDVVLARAGELKSRTPRLNASESFEYLVSGGSTVLPPVKLKVRGRDGQSATISIDEVRKVATINLMKFDSKRAKEIERLIKDFLSSGVVS